MPAVSRTRANGPTWRCPGTRPAASASTSTARWSRATTERPSSTRRSTSSGRTRASSAPTQVQSAYNFVRGGDIDEMRIYDRMLSDDNSRRAGARGAAPARSGPTPSPLDVEPRGATSGGPATAGTVRTIRRRPSRAGDVRIRKVEISRRLRRETLVVEGHRRHPRNDMARRVQPIAPAGTQRLLPAARLGLLLRSPAGR